MFLIFTLILGLVLLVFCANLFVDSAASLANGFKVPKMVIALTIAAFCTCAPELSISFNSISSGDYDVTLANVIGSCVVNILLIVGIAAIVKPITIKTSTVRKELPLLLITTIVFAFLFIDKSLSRIDAIILIALFSVFCVYLVRMIKRFSKTEDEPPKYDKLASIFISAISIAVIIVASDMVVDATVALAETFGVPAKLITMTIIVIGTSLPELTITVSSAKKGEFDMTVGNIIGTNIFNICIVLGIPVLFFGTISTNAFGIIDLLMIILAALLFFTLGKSEKTITRLEGVLMLITFFTYYAYLFIG